MKIYVGNLSYEVTEEDLRLALEQFGQVESAQHPVLATRP
ncbi:MAG: RNA-binding protein [Proteobacteria bacterium]|nr:RNA-binding protein [Pseudomonadota bacterium]